MNCSPALTISLLLDDSCRYCRQRRGFSMKHIFLAILALMLLDTAPLLAQQQPPFIFTVYGGLFFPSNEQFHDTYKSNSEAIWGVGVCLPVEPLVFITGDIAFFRPEASMNAQGDSTVSLEENFIHWGLLAKQPLGQQFFVRFSGGMSYVTIRQKYSSPRSPEQTLQADKKVGYYGGIGLEKMVESGRAALFADIVYDYRRSRQKELEGDFGGVRLVVGLHVFLF